MANENANNSTQSSSLKPTMSSSTTQPEIMLSTTVQKISSSSYFSNHQITI